MKKNNTINFKEVIVNTSNNSSNLIISINKQLTQNFLKLATSSIRLSSNSKGFKKGTITTDYVEINYQKNILKYLEELLLKFFVLSYLTQKIKDEKINIIGSPELLDIKKDEYDTINYYFKVIKPIEIYIKKWKSLPFKLTKRKKYRDIDKQVELFIENEKNNYKINKNNTQIQLLDWVLFDLTLIDKNENAIFGEHKVSLWIKIGNEEADFLIQELFCNKKINDSFITNSNHFQEFFCNLYNQNYYYKIKIKDIVHNGYFSLSLFKNYFKLKTKKELDQKFAEIFSFNADISQRRLISNEALSVIIKKNIINIDTNSIELQKSLIIEDLKKNPDLIIYKMNKDFNTQLTNLAKKQLLEIIVTENIAYQENLHVTDLDIKGLLNLTQRKRTQEFIYFPFIQSRIKGAERPILHESLKQICLREKSLNYIIQNLTKL